MTPERAIFINWLQAKSEAQKESGSRYANLIAMQMGANQILADYLGITWIEANRLLLNWEAEGVA